MEEYGLELTVADAGSGNLGSGQLGNRVGSGLKCYTEPAIDGTVVSCCFSVYSYQDET